MRYRNLVQPLEILIIHTNNQLQFDYIKTDSSKKKQIVQRSDVNIVIRDWNT
jgi:hypothetical protein